MDTRLRLLWRHRLFQQRPVRNHEIMERWLPCMAWEKVRKQILHTKKRCLLCEDLVPVSKDKLKVFGKSQLDLGALTESHQSWCRCLRWKPQPIIFFTPLTVWVWETETTVWEIQEKGKNFETQKWQIEAEQQAENPSVFAGVYDHIHQLRCTFS